MVDLLRQSLDVQREQLACQKTAAQAHDMASRWKEIVARWKDGEGAVRAHELFRLNIAQSWNVQPGTRNFSDVYLTGLTPERVDQAVQALRSL